MIFRLKSAAFVLLGFSLNVGVAAAQTPPAAEEPPAAEAPAAEPAPPPPPPPVVVAPAPAPVSTAFTPLKVESNGNSIRIGLLFQPTYRAANSANPALSGYSENMFIRRTRVLVGGSLFGKFDYFLDTDYPNLFLATPEAANAMNMTPATNGKAGPGMYIQDAFITARPVEGEFKDAFKIDAGFMLPPMAHNALQGAGTLYSLDYYSNSFLHTNVFGGTAPVGRDLGVQVRGLVMNRVEYRLGLFQGLRLPQSDTQVNSHNFFRVTGRVQINLLDAEPGFFYAGTYLGTKKIFSLGGSADLQNNYKYFNGDVFVDMPAGPGVLTAQVNYAHWNGDGFVALPKEWAVMGEVGYNFSTIVSPLLRGEYLVATAADGTETKTSRYGGGVNWWTFGHNVNLKSLYQFVKVDGASKGFNQIDLQWQLYFY
jgi:hypothetical protein